LISRCVLHEIVVSTLTGDVTRFRCTVNCMRVICALLMKRGDSRTASDAPHDRCWRRGIFPSTAGYIPNSPRSVNRTLRQRREFSWAPCALITCANTQASLRRMNPRMKTHGGRLSIEYHWEYIRRMMVYFKGFRDKGATSAISTRDVGDERISWTWSPTCIRADEFSLTKRNFPPFYFEATLAEATSRKLRRDLTTS